MFSNFFENKEKERCNKQTKNLPIQNLSLKVKF